MDKELSGEEKRYENKTFTFKIKVEFGPNGYELSSKRKFNASTRDAFYRIQAAAEAAYLKEFPREGA